MPPSRSIYLNSDGELTIREITETYVPTGAQDLVSVKYSSVNPGDLRHYYMGLHSFVAGYDWMGTVVTPGPESAHRPGDVLFGFANFGHRRPLHRGAHQDLMLADPFMTYEAPADVAADPGRWPEVAAWPAIVMTAVDALFNSMGFAFPPLGDGVVGGADPKGRSILIWGGASSVGAAAIQIAAAAGFNPIYATASPKNHAALDALGATACFDYRSPTVVDEIRAAASASGKELSAIFDAVTVGTGFGDPPSDVVLDPGKSSPVVARRALTDGAKDVRLSSTLPVESDPDWTFCLCVRTEDEEPEFHDRLLAVTNWIWKNHEGTIKVPNVRIVHGAEEGIQAIHDVFDGRTSFEKVVIQHPM